MPNSTQNVQRDINQVSHAADAISRGSDTFLALLEYVSNRTYADRNAAIILSQAKKDGNLSMSKVDRADRANMEKLMDSVGMNYMSCKINSDGKENLYFMFPKSQEEMYTHLREVYLAKERRVFAVNKDTVKSFSKEPELGHVTGLSYAEMCYLKDRLVKNKIMFDADRAKDGTYSIYFRNEDKQKVDLLASGVRQEKEGSGSKIFKQMNEERSAREKAVSLVMSSPEESYFIANGNGSKSMYVTNEGLYFEREGKYAMREFVSRSSDDFEKKLCRHMDEIRYPKVIDGKKAEDLGESLKSQVEKGDTGQVVSLEESLRIWGFKSLKEVNEVKLTRKKEQEPDLFRNQDAVEAYYRLQRSIDVFHTKQEGTSRSYVTGPEKEAFEAEHQARMDFEFCVNCGDGNYAQAARQYTSGELGPDQVSEFAKEHSSDVRKNMDWREPYDMPDYLDQNGDQILDEYQMDEFEQNNEDIELH